MSKVTITALTVDGEYHGPLTGPFIARLEAKEEFSDSAGVRIAKGSGYKGFGQDFACAIDVDGIFTISAGDAYATTNSSKPSVKYRRLAIYDTTANRLVRALYAKNGIRIPATPTTTTWEALRIYTEGAATVVVTDMDLVNDLIEEQVDAAFDGFSSSSFAKTAYVEVNGNNATGEVGNTHLPFATIDAALLALAPNGGVLQIGVGDFAKPTTANIIDNIWWKGSQRPVPDWTVTLTAWNAHTLTAPTKLQYGTVIKGNVNISDRKNQTFTDLGVDIGSAYVGAGGSQGNCIGCGLTSISGNTGATPPYALLQGIVIHNVTLLGDSASSLFHSLVLEDCYQPSVTDLLTIGNTWGVATKCVGGYFRNINSCWNASGGIILKVDNYALSRQTILDGFYIRSLDLGAKESAGLKIMGNSSYTGGGFIITNGQIDSTANGVAQLGTAAIDDVIISNVNVRNSGGNSVYLANLPNGQIHNCVVHDANGNGIVVFTPTSGYTYLFGNVVHDIVSPGGSGAYWINGGNIVGANNAGYNNTTNYAPTGFTIGAVPAL